MPRLTETLGQRLKLARKALGLSQTELADQAGMKQSDISKLELGSMQKTTGIGRLSRALGVPDVWLELGEGPEPIFDEGRLMLHAVHDLAEAQAQRLSQDAPMITPKQVMWEDVMTDESERFTLEAEDDSMLPLLAKGQLGIFSRKASPVPGKPVLLIDRNKKLYIREYRPRTDEHWRAVALNGHDPLDSIADGLDIVAAMVGVLWE